MRSLRAICPNCGGKIATRPKGLGNITWANSWLLAETGTECQFCGVALTGKITAGGKAVLDLPKQDPFPQPVVTAPAREGWWPDPTGRFDHRYFNGRFWTEHVTRDTEQRQLVDRTKVVTPR